MPARRLRPGPIVALLLLVGLGAWVYLKEFRGDAGSKAGTDTKDRPIPFERAALKAFHITNSKGSVRLEKNGEAWTITEPFPADADKEAIESLLTTLEIARVERRIGAVPDLKAYGLDPRKTVLTIETAGGSPLTLVVGDASPVGGTSYALLPGGTEVAVVGSGVADIEKKDLLALRDKTLLSFEPWKVKRVRLERGRETLLLEKPADGWKISRPVEAPADGPAVTDLLNAIERLRAREFVVEKPAPADLRQHRLEPAAVRLSILQEGWDVEKTLLFGRRPGGTIYGRTVGRDPIVSLPDDVWEKTQTKVSDLRRKEILGVGQYRIETIAVSGAGRPALSLARQKDGSWALSGSTRGTVKADTADLLLRALGGLKAQGFEDRPPEALLAALGRRPDLDLTLQEEAGASGGPGAIQHLVFGVDAKKRLLARDMAWRPLSVLPAGALAPINEAIDSALKAAAESAAAAASPSPSPDPAPSPTP